MKPIQYVFFFILSAFIICGCNQSGPEITVSGVWSRPVELVSSNGSNHQSNGSGQAKAACCADKETNAAKPACCASDTQKPACCTDGGGVNGVVYLKIENSGGKPDRLLGATSSVAKVVEIHETKMQNDRMSMQKVAAGIEIPAGETIEMKPGGYHIMLIGLKQALKIDDAFDLELEFRESQKMRVTSNVKLF